MICTSCQTDVPSDAAFCARCGSKLTTDKPSVSDPLLAALEQAAGAQYEIIRLLGRGGMGAVYLAREAALDRLVAIKVLPPEGADSEGYERFRREAKTAAKLTHPNIVPLYTFGEAHGVMYFVMGYVSGESLKARLQRAGKIEFEETRRILADVASALHYAHEQGVVHRDIKPDNILIEDETGKPMLTDFGVAKSVAPGETLTQVGATIGTPHYMSPEQAAGDRDIDGRSDLYSLGVVGYEMVSGGVPFEGDGVRELLVQHVTKEPVPLGVLDPAVPEDLARVIDQCMAKDSTERLLDGMAVHTALGVLNGPHEQMPPDLEEIVDRLRFMGVMSGGLGAIAYVLLVAGDGGAAVPLLISGVGLFAFVAFSERQDRKLGRYSWREILKWVFRQPKRWTMWWPRFLRPADDMWDRLPKPVKRGRVAQGLFAFSFAAFFATFAGLLWSLLDPGSPETGWIESSLILGFFLWIGGMSWTLFEVFQMGRWAKRIGLAESVRMKLGSAPNADVDFWTQPPLDQFLQAGSIPRESPSEALPKTPQAFVDAIVRMVAEQEGAPKQIAEEAAAVGRELFVLIKQVDERIHRLGEEADPNEVLQLEQKLAVLAEPVESESSSQRRKRELLEEQLSLARRLTTHFEDAKTRRDQLVEMLKTVWRHLSNLRAHADDTAFDSGEISGKVRALSDDVRRYLAAAEDTDRLLDGRE